LPEWAPNCAMCLHSLEKFHAKAQS
jgi:hypothetical protein